MKNWILNKALAAHLVDPKRFEHGPARSSLWGWFYFRVLCGIR